jgi:type II secretory pathway component PulM
MLSEVLVWFAATRDKHGLLLLGVFLLLVVLAVLVWNIIP